MNGCIRGRCIRQSKCDFHPKLFLVMLLKPQRHAGEKEIDVVAACASFQYAAGIPPRQFEFGKGFLPSTDDEDAHQPGAKRGDGLERSFLHIAYNNDAMEIMDTPVGRAILNYKWVTYGKRAYYRSMIAPMLMIAFTSLQSCIWYLVIACGDEGDEPAADPHRHVPCTTVGLLCPHVGPNDADFNSFCHHCANVVASLNPDCFGCDAQRSHNGTKLAVPRVHVALLQPYTNFGRSAWRQVSHLICCTVA